MRQGSLRERRRLMVRYENDCVGCPPEMGCIGDTCQYRNVPIFMCDQCGEDGDIYEYEGQHYCADCLLALFEKVS